ncbi:MAG: DUF882 domain-containing protein [Myxococcales bacterium]|nr:DUF882 domain-containing protein [Myxococcales bacterium]
MKGRTKKLTGSWALGAVLVFVGLTVRGDAEAQIRNRPLASAAAAPQWHVVARGETLSAIATRYSTTVARIAERNHLAPPYALRNGQQLRLPTLSAAMPTAPSPAPATPPRAPANPATAHPPPAARPAPAVHPAAPTSHHQPQASSRYGRPRHPGVVVMRRLAFDEHLTANLRQSGRATLATMRRFLRATGGESHAIERRLMRQLAVVSDHFGGRQVEVISGYRPFRRGQHTAHSNHNVGHALDFRVVGVRNRAVYDFCRTLPNTGCGFYPRSVFVHMDTRSGSATWVDWSRPGERPRYGTMAHPPAAHPSAVAAPSPPPESAPPPAGADPELDDVADEHPPIRTATPEPDDGNDVTDSLPGGQ